MVFFFPFCFFIIIFYFKSKVLFFLQFSESLLIDLFVVDFSEWILGQCWMVRPLISTLRRFGYGAGLSLPEDGSLSGLDCREVRAC